MGFSESQTMWAILTAFISKMFIALLVHEPFLRNPEYPYGTKWE
jgi:hypothetical protein